MRLKQFLLVLSLILIPFFIGAYFPQGVQFGRNLSISVTQPFLNGASELSGFVRSQWRFLGEALRARRENQELRETAEDLKRQISDLKEIKLENDRLRRLLKFQTENSFKTISAQIIGHDISHWSYYVTINKGSKDGIYPEMAVLAGNGLAGKVVDVTEHAANVILLIDSESKASSLVQETRDVGLVEGNGTPLLKMTYIDLHAQLQVGQMVVTSGLGGIYPKGIPIGQIVQISEDQSRFSLSAIVKPLAEFSKLEEVLCVDRKGGVRR